MELPETPRVAPSNDWLDVELPEMVWLRLMMRNGSGFAGWDSKSPMFDETEHLDAISWREFRAGYRWQPAWVEVEQIDQSDHLEYPDVSFRLCFEAQSKNCSSYLMVLN